MANKIVGNIKTQQFSILTFMHKIIIICIKINIGTKKMRTTLDLPEELLIEAMSVSHIKTKTKVITLALQELIRKSEVSELKKFKGKIDLNIDLDTIRDRS
ncbi:type II toxin-antitoxin system VapB family antitoxin [sulfur-oxidizing endosymbiont of Gigantopelta aegis]|uniref:type II toxin-antitoxin system VapB family antitoxin n=1 Tax=sulfur-oxidizing endosymbiont of Gigantopelta aegis TaxID=2794934 RepID=UPI003CCE4072